MNVIFSAFYRVYWKGIMSGKKPPYTGIEKLLHTFLYNKTQVCGALIRVFLK